MFWKKKKIEKSYPYLGEVYMANASSYYGGSKAAHIKSPDGFDYCFKFEKFKESNIGKTHDGYLEIFGIFHKKENIFYYNDIYSPLRDKIIKRNSK